MSSLPARVAAAEFDWADASGVAAGVAAGVASEVRRVVGAASAADGRSPLNEQALLSLRHDGLSSASLWIGDGGTGFALADGQPGADEVEVNLVVDPAGRGHGTGTALAGAVLDAFPEARITAWSHGNHPAAVVLAKRCGFARVRDLWVMRRVMRRPLPPLPALPLNRRKVGAEPAQSEPRTGAEYEIRAFRPGQDEEAFLAVNAEAFAHHPEQGEMTRADLGQRMAEPWFDADGFFVAESDSGGLLGFHWTKVHEATGTEPAYGEVYVVGIAPAAQGMGLGKALTLTGLHHLESRGLGEVILYVEADNAAAIAVYEGLGFTHADADTDVMYERAR